MPTKGSAKAAGHDLYPNEGTEIPPRGQPVVGTGIAMELPHNTHGRIAPQGSLAVKNQLSTNADVRDADYRGEVKVVLVNQGDQPYPVEKGDRIAQFIIEKINNVELQHQQNVKTTPGPPRGVMVPLVLLVHPDPPWSTFSVNF